VLPRAALDAPRWAMIWVVVRIFIGAAILATE
jgi:hypothetical protein